MGSPIEDAIEALLGGTGGGGGETDREALRRELAALGIDLPVTLGEVQQIANQLSGMRFNVAKTEAELNQLLEQAAGGLSSKQLQDIARKREELNSLRTQLDGVNGRFRDYAVDYFKLDKESGMARSLFREESVLLRPERPRIEKLPTPEEFMGEFNNAFSTFSTGIAGRLTLAEERYLREELRPMMFERYVGALGDIAKRGESPFILKEATREERGIALGMPAGEALQAAVGPGVSEPTRITAGGPTRIETAGSPEEMLQKQLAQAQDVDAARQQIEETGTGVPREFIALPKIAPLDFLQQTFSEQSIRILAAGAARPQGISVMARRI